MKKFFILFVLFFVLTACENSYEKEDFIKEYSRVYCEKYIECDDSERELNNCISDLEEDIGNDFYGEICEIYNGNIAYEIVNCVENYSCSEELSIKSSCMRKNLLRMCGDKNGVRDDAIKYSEEYCDYYAKCNQNYDSDEECVVSEQLLYYGNNLMCNNYNNEAFDNTINCIKSLSCSEYIQDCEEESRNICTN